MQERILVLPDIHLPYASDAALVEAARFAKGYRPTIVVQLGDMFDCHSVTGHMQNPNKARLFIQERDSGWAQLAPLLKVLRKTAGEFHFTEGNHELWLRKKVWGHAPALEGLLVKDPFRLHEHGFKVVPYRQMLKIGKVYFNHDIGGAGPNAAQKALDIVQGNIIQGHNHRACMVVETNGKGVSHFGISAGWLGDPAEVADYMSPFTAAKKWTHSVVRVDMNPDGTALPQIVPLF